MKLNSSGSAGVTPTVLAANLEPLKAKFVTTSSTTISNTTNETSILGSGVGNLIIPANAIPAGTVIALSIWGTYQTKASGQGTLTIRVKSQGTVIASTVLSNLPANVASPIGLEIRGHTTVRSLGVNGQNMAAGVVNYIGTDSMKLASSVISQLTTVDSTIDRTIDITAQWSVADTANILIITNVILNSVLPPSA